MNYFAKQEAATRYVSSRPNIHPMVMTHIKTFLSLPYPLSRALDVGCGTGQSSLALTTLASEVFGVDASLAMLQEAVQDARIQYRHASAESLPFPTSSFPMMTVAIAFHWFHRPLFLELCLFRKQNATHILPVVLMSFGVWSVFQQALKQH